jgi:hypothetical protein
MRFGFSGAESLGWLLKVCYLKFGTFRSLSVASTE